MSRQLRQQCNANAYYSPQPGTLSETADGAEPGAALPNPVDGGRGAGVKGWRGSHVSAASQCAYAIELSGGTGADGIYLRDGAKVINGRETPHEGTYEGTFDGGPVSRTLSGTDTIPVCSTVCCPVPGPVRGAYGTPFAGPLLHPIHVAAHYGS
eukprot:gene19934-23431_t